MTSKLVVQFRVYLISSIPENTQALSESLKLLSWLIAPITITHQQTLKPAGLNWGDHKLQSTAEVLTKQIIISKPHKQKKVYCILRVKWLPVPRLTQPTANQMGSCKQRPRDPSHNPCYIITVIFIKFISIMAVNYSFMPLSLRLHVCWRNGSLIFKLPYILAQQPAGDLWAFHGCLMRLTP